MISKKLQAAALSLALVVPTGTAFARTRHHHYTTTSYTTHRHHYSRTRGAVIGAVAGAVVDHRHPVTGALIGGALGDAVQAVRNHH